MPFREKAKRLFKSSSRSDSLSKTDSKDSSRERWPSNVYKPGEPMPRPKYRAQPKKEHTEKLEAFSFADAWRKKSFQSSYSPMGTRAPSRRNSLFSRKSFGGKSTAARTGSVTSTGTARSGANRMETQQEAEGDDDVGNVGMSRVQSKDHHSPAESRPRTTEDEQSGGMTNGLHKTSTALDHQPFSEEEFALAMNKTKTHLEVPPGRA